MKIGDKHIYKDRTQRMFSQVVRIRKKMILDKYVGIRRDREHSSCVITRRDGFTCESNFPSSMLYCLGVVHKWRHTLGEVN